VGFFCSITQPFKVKSHLFKEYFDLMKSRFYIVFILTMSLSLMVFQCEDDSKPTMEDEQKALISSKDFIEDLAATAICNESTECKFIALGSKPCGGPWSYLVYSTSIEVNKLEGMVEDYNKNEAAFNLKWEVISDCSFLLPPTSVICENNKCVAVY